MDPADADSVKNALSSHGNLLGQHHQTLQELMDSQQTLSSKVTQIGRLVETIANQLSAPSALTPSPSSNQSASSISSSGPPVESPVPAPEPFSGELAKSKGFLLQCSLVFGRQFNTFSSDCAKVSYITGLLRGRALEWAEAFLSSSGADAISYADFVGEFKKVFAHPNVAADAAKRLLSLRQGQRSVADYSIEFRILGTESKWDDHALRGVFVHGLSETMKDELTFHDEPKTLDDLISLSIRLDNRQRERRREKDSRINRAPPRSQAAPIRVHQGTPSPLAPPPVASQDEPMQVGRARLDAAERQRRMDAGACIYCGQLGHFLRDCSIRPKGPAHQ